MVWPVGNSGISSYQNIPKLMRVMSLENHENPYCLYHVLLAVSISLVDIILLLGYSCRVDKNLPIHVYSLHRRKVGEIPDRTVPHAHHRI